MLERERVFAPRLFPAFERVVVVSYGDAGDVPLARTLAPEMGERVQCVCNDGREEPGAFIAGVPGRVRSVLGDARSVLVLTDQHYGGDVGVCIARALREEGDAGRRVGLVARGGYHWAWFVAREQGAESPAYAQARMLEGELVHAADVVIGTSGRMIDDMAMLHGAPRGKFRLVPNFVVCDEPPADFTARDPGLILAAGRLHPQKRFDLLIEALGRLPVDLQARASLVIFGQGPEEARLRDMAARSPVSVRIQPRIPHRELLALMGRCAVYAQCSAYEGHPKTIIEAMAAGCPVLVTEGPGVSENIQAGVTGLVAPGEVGAVAGMLAHLLTRRDEAARLGAAAAAHARRVLSFEAVFPLYRRACVEAMTLAGEGATVPPATVRWDPPLLMQTPEAAAANWGAGLAAFTRRLNAEQREAFLSELAARMESLHAPAEITGLV